MMPIDFTRAQNDHMNKTTNIKKENKKHNLNSTHSEFNLIDLLDDVHITPQTSNNDKEKQIADYQIKMLEEFLTTSKLKNTQTEQQNAEFRSFFDKYEFSAKHEAPSYGIVKLESEDIRQFEHKTENKPERLENNACAVNFYDDTPKVLVPRLTATVKLEPDDREEVNEDLIEEVMFEQHLERQLLNSNKKDFYKTKEIENTKNVLWELPKMETEKYHVDHSNIFNAIVTENQIKHFAVEADKINLSKFNNCKLLNTVCPTNTPIDKGNSLKTKTKSEEKALTEELVTKYDIKYLEAMKMVDKIFRKQSDLRSDAEKSKLTPGPSLYEKSVVLPQIMRRIKERQKAVEGKSMIKMKLILDTYHSTTPHKNTNIESSYKTPIPSGINDDTSSQVLHADCNRARLVAFETGKLFNKFVRTGNHFAK